MSDIYIGPANLKGLVIPPPSKSVAHRALVLAALAEKSPQRMEAILGISAATSKDIEATMGCLKALLDPREGKAELNCHESGSTLRFLIPVAAALGRAAIFRGEGRLAERPLDEYEEILKDKGTSLEFHQEGLSLPLTIRGKLQSGEFKVPGHISSQYITGLMLALPLLEGESTIVLTSPLQSAPYVEMTRAVLEQFGLKAETIRGTRGELAGWRVPGRQLYKIPAGGVDVEADYSQAAFWLVAKFLGQEIWVESLNPQSAQGDRAIISILTDMEKSSPDEQLIIDSEQIPDLVPILTVAASQRLGQTVIKNAGRLRFKESDRLLATAKELNRIGGCVTEGVDYLAIQGGKILHGGEVDSHGDHRIAMAMAIAALTSQKGVLIRGAQAVNKSYPDFFRELKRLGGDVRGLELG